MADSAILREYLVALAFQIDKTGEKKANQAITSLDKQALSLGKNVAAVGVAVTGMVTIFASQMEKLYYSSLKTNSTVGSLQALEYGARQVGISSDQMRGSLEGFARTMRLNPGMIAFLSGKMGISTQGKETAQVYSEFIDKLGEMPFFLAAKFGAMFGQDPDSLYLMIKQRKEMKAAEQERKAMAAAVGVDMDQAAKDARDYNNALRALTSRVELFSSALLSAMLPAFKQVTQAIGAQIDALTRAIVIANTPAGSDAQKNLYKGLTSAGNLQGLGGKVFENMRRMTPGFDWLAEMRDQQKPVPFHWFSKGVAPAPGVTGGAQMAPAEMFAALERKYALPAGMLDRMWSAESSRGVNMRSPAGAEGHFGWMGDKVGMANRAKYGVNNPNDLYQSAQGTARYMADLINQYGGDVPMALAGYNWGSGNMAKAGVMSQFQLGRAPAETQDYIKKVAPNLSTSYTINLGPNGYSAGDQQRLEQTMRDNNADMVRQFLVRNR